MNNKNPSMSPQRARERALFLYASALERGDFDTVAAVFKLAERDPILDQMIQDLDSLTVVPAAAQEAHVLPPLSDKHIQQIVTVKTTPSNGQTPKFDHHEEEDTMYMTYEPIRSQTSPRFDLRILTMVAAVVMLVLIGGVLIQMVNNNPTDGYPAVVALQTEEPKCAAESVSDPAAESVRLAEAASAQLEPRALLDTPLEDRPAVIAQSGLLAICALRTAYTPEADEVLQRTMGMNGAAWTFTGNNIGGVFSPDGRYLLTGDNMVLRLWDVATGEEFREFVGHTGYILALAFSPDGRYVLSGSEDKTARMWDVETGQEIRSLLHTNVVPIVAFSPDGSYLLTSGEYQNQSPYALHLWDAVTGQEIRHLTGHQNEIFGAAFSPDGRYVATSGWDTTVRLWDAATGDELRQFQPFTGFAGMVAFSSDGKYLLNSGSFAVRLSDVETGETIREYTNQGSRVLGFPSFSPDGRYVLASDRDSRLALLWDAETGELVRTFNGRLFDPDAGRMFNVNFSPDGRSIVMGTANGNGGFPYNRVWLWDTDYHDTIARACQHVTRDFTPEERAQYGLGEGSVCP